MLKPIADFIIESTWDSFLDFVEVEFVYIGDGVLRIVVLPLLSKPMMMILSYFLPESLENIFVKNPPINRSIAYVKFNLLFISNSIYFFIIILFYLIIYHH